MPVLFSDLRTTLRTLFRAPGFLAGAVLCLALGLGANAVLFNAAHALLWRPLAFRESHRVVSTFTRTPQGQQYSQLSPGLAGLLRDRTEAFSEVGLVRMMPHPVVVHPDTDGPELGVGSVNLDYLNALDLHPLLGRFFTEEEVRSGDSSGLLTEASWRRDFGADPGIVGRTVPTLSEGKLGQLRILGVIQGGATLPFLAKAQVLVPGPVIAPFDGSYDGEFSYMSVLRLKPGMGRHQAQAKVQAALAAAETPWPSEARGTRLRVEPLRDVLAPVHPKAILLLYGAAALLLVLTCANVASLFLDRALGRSRDTAVRLALGARLGQVLKTTFLESLLVVGAGSLLALMLERLARPLLLDYLPDLRVLGAELLATGPLFLIFSLLSGLGVALAVALLAALQTRNPALARSLTEGGRQGSPGATPWRSFLVVAQVAIILVLLTVGSLVGRSFLQALRVDPGFQPRGVIAFHATPTGEGRRWTPKAYDLRDLIRGLPGTQSVAFTSESPLDELYTAQFKARETPERNVTYKLVGSDYFETLGARLTAGRAFSEDEVRRFGPVVMVNERAARSLFGTAEPVGQVILSGLTGADAMVVGVVKDMRIAGLDRDAPAVVYLPYSSHFKSLAFLVRTTAQPAAFTAVLKAQVRAHHPGVRLGGFESLEATTAKTIQHRLRAGILVGGFALLGLAIGAVGLYSTLSSQVRQRRREIGTRMALGASPRHIAQRFLGRGARLVGMGALAGLGGSLLAAQIVRVELYEVSPMDAPSFLLALTLLLLTALLACLLPALRASRMHPAETLGAE